MVSTRLLVEYKSIELFRAGLQDRPVHQHVPQCAPGAAARLMDPGTLHPPLYGSEQRIRIERIGYGVSPTKDRSLQQRIQAQPSSACVPLDVEGNPGTLYLSDQQQERRDSRTRTCNFLLPKQGPYQIWPYPEVHPDRVLGDNGGSAPSAPPKLVGGQRIEL